MQENWTEQKKNIVEERHTLFWQSEVREPLQRFDGRLVVAVESRSRNVCKETLNILIRKSVYFL